MVPYALVLSDALRFVFIVTFYLTFFATSAYAEGAERTQNGKPITAGITATRTTMEALSGAIGGGFSGGLNMFRMQLSKFDEMPERGMSASAADSSWNVWSTPVFSTVNNQIEPLLTEGSVSLILAGIEYTFDEFTVLGVSFTRDWARVNTIERAPFLPDRRSVVRGLGFTFAPYLAHQLSPDWLIDFSIGKGESELKSTQTDLSIAYPKDVRSFASVGATYLKPLARGAMFTGKLNASFARDAIDDFVSVLPSGAATTVDGSNSILRQYKIGGQVSQQLGNFTPFFGAYGIVNGFTVTTDAQIKPREHSRVVQTVAGINASSGPIYAALILQRERDRNQARIYIGVRY